MKLAFNDFGDLLETDADRPIIILPRLWDFADVEVRGDCAVVTSESLGAVVLTFAPLESEPSGLSDVRAA
jgi:hypothetical protein